MTTKEFDGTAYELDSTLIINYFDRLTGRIFKIIPIKEEGEFDVQPYIESLLRELLGARSLVEAIGHDERFMQIISIMNYLLENPNTETKVLKSEIFHILNILKKINKAYTDRTEQPPSEAREAET